MQMDMLLERHSRKDADEEIAEGTAGDTISDGEDTCQIRDTSEGLWLWATQVRQEHS